MTPRDLRPEMWRIVRRVGAQGRIFDVDAVRGQLRGAIRRERVSDYLKALAAGGYLARVAPDEERLGEGFQLVRDPGAEVPRVRPDGTPIVQGAGREQCWRTMKILGHFSAIELAVTARVLAATRLPPEEQQDEIRRRAAEPGYHLIAEGRPALEAELGFRPPLRLRLHRFYARLGIQGYIGIITLLTLFLLALSHRLLVSPDEP